MLILKVLVFKNNKQQQQQKYDEKQCIAIIYYKQRLSLFGRDDNPLWSPWLHILSVLRRGLSNFWATGILNGINTANAWPI